MRRVLFLFVVVVALTAAMFAASVADALTQIQEPQELPR